MNICQFSCVSCLHLTRSDHQMEPKYCKCHLSFAIKVFRTYAEAFKKSFTALTEMFFSTKDKSTKSIIFNNTEI